MVEPTVLGADVRVVPRATVRVAPSAVIGECCVLGCVKEARLRGAGADLELCAAADVVIGERCQLFNQVVIYEGSRLGDGCVVEDRVRIGYDTCVGHDARLLYGAFICDRVTIGDEARVAGFICDGTSSGTAATEEARIWKDLSHALHLSGVESVFCAEDDPSGGCVKTTRPAGMRIDYCSGQLHAI